MKLTSVAASRDSAAARLLAVVSRKTNTVAMTAHIPPSASSAADTEYAQERTLLVSQ